MMFMLTFSAVVFVDDDVAVATAGDYEMVITLSYWGRDKNGRHFLGDILKWIFLNENIWIATKLKHHRSLFPGVQLKTSQHWFR